MPISRLVALENKLKAVGIPVVGISDGTPNGQTLSAQYVTITYGAGATQQQIDQGEDIKAGWDYAPRRSLTRTQIVNGFTQLTQTQRNLLLAHVIAVVFRQGFIAADYEAFLGAQGETGVPLAVDEVIP